MENFLKEFYYGNLAPQEQPEGMSTRMKEIVKKLEEEEQDIAEKLSDADKEKFTAYMHTWLDLNSVSDLENFIRGFRLGARFTYDTFVGT